MSHATRRGIAGLAILLAPACHLLPHAPRAREVPVYWGSAADVDQVRRVLVLGFDAPPDVTGEADAVRAAFVAELAKMQRFELVTLTGEQMEDDRVARSVRRGRISLESLAVLAERHRVDGVLIGTITGYRPYKPPHLGLRVQLVSVHSATPVWASEVFYDAGDARTIEDMQHYASSFAAEDESLHGWQLTLISPRRFAGYVAHRVVGTWRAASWYHD